MKTAWAAMTVVLVLLIAAVAIYPTRTLADDVGQVTITGQPLDGWAGITSNTAELFGFYTARTPSTPGSGRNNGDWTTTYTQWLADATSHALSRTQLLDWLEITNFTSYTIYISLNECWQVPNYTTNLFYVNETTQTLSNTVWQFRLDPSTTAFPYRMQIDSQNAPWLFPIDNVGIFFYDTDTDYFTSAAIQANVTSQTIVLRGR